SIVSPAKLRTALSHAREDGVAYDDCESNEAVRCVAAPVRDHSGRTVAAMSISVPTVRWNDERRTEWTDLIRGGAAQLSQRLGHRGGPRPVCSRLERWSGGGATHLGALDGDHEHGAVSDHISMMRCPHGLPREPLGPDA